MNKYPIIPKYRTNTTKESEIVYKERNKIFVEVYELEMNLAMDLFSEQFEYDHVYKVYLELWLKLISKKMKYFTWNKKYFDNNYLKIDKP